jgi:prevent-host-death family protein
MVLKKTMTTVNTIELKTQANRLLDRVSTKHQVVLITRRGKPCAALVPVSEETLVDLLWEYSPEVQRRLRTAMEELRAGKVESPKAFAARHGLAE